MELIVNYEQDPIIIFLESVFDSFNNQRVKEKILLIIENNKNKNIRLDFKGIKFIDSTAIGAIVHIHKRLRCNKNQLEIINTSEQPYGLFKLIGIDKLMTIERFSP